MNFSEISNLKTLIRADSGSKIGHGHVRRDLILAQNFKDASFACIDMQGSLADEIPYPVFTLKSADIGELVNLIKQHKFELLVIDHYGISAADEKLIKEQTNIKILSFDDNYKEHFCDYLLNVNIYAQPQKYVNLVPANCELVFSPLVRSEFYDEAKIKREKKFDYFIALGGTDALNLTAKIASNLLAKNKKVATITTSANVNLANLQNLADSEPNFSLFINSNEVARLMNESEILVISASSLVNEALVLGAKFKAVRVADNQNEMAQWLAANGREIYEVDEICLNL
ncbi:UDP-2,4-diacetamido-2,4,6-trideoxy-beta-L-altropyranose hydrolase [Campylobacter sp. Marseille-Q3452]|uniref:UDP-2,4-diacetamido-2,4, 6-trideoxy-beta-L-altropyranose hydrolase n=1 Tax=Campylobacter massiliensis TaxID=2762557 RepID=A0A842J4T6_9BACT|nr:UDP-2,4-diacetamido-2,4,6-trideoxy-beta-L-altropyranose hydrolase [Campylobacter massiliensis]MBC2882866.1 UDP-2,4-diacetamido-2,4,6-trideoxy-beta-L-altropyranose hydrolase [Campylobacter massiliensis]